tara:strand:- start:4627 stop:5103 length:477 start_codon:yes stop_codon:yes gene_type:complete
MTNTDRVSQMESVQKEGLELFRKKNQDYGDAFANYGAIGILVRMGDKISRLQSISSKNISLINTESLRDTLIDLHNYAAMAIMLIDEDKDKLLIDEQKYTNIIDEDTDKRPRQTLPSPINRNKRDLTPAFNRCMSEPAKLNELIKKSLTLITNKEDSD